MGYDYIDEGGITVETRDQWDVSPLVEAMQHILKNTRRVLEIKAMRVSESPNKWVLSWKNLEHSVTY